MTARSLLTAIGSAALGLISLGALLFVERALLRFAAPLVGLSWIPTARIILECGALMAVGWLIGRWGSAGVLVFAATIALVRVGDVQWLFRLFLDCFQNSRYWASFLNSLGIHFLLLASLFLGANWSGKHEPVLLRIK
jgi:hypothetical protein